MPPKELKQNLTELEAADVKTYGKHCSGGI